MDEVIPSLSQRAWLEPPGRSVPRWEAKAMQPQPTTATGDGKFDRERKRTIGKERTLTGIAEQGF
jgi:hypothetical protein